MRFRLLPEIVGLDDLERSTESCCRKDVFFEVHCTNLNEDRSILSATKM